MQGVKEAEVIRLRCRNSVAFFCFLPNWLNNEELFFYQFFTGIARSGLIKNPGTLHYREGEE